MQSQFLIFGSLDHFFFYVWNPENDSRRGSIPLKMRIIAVSKHNAFPYRVAWWQFYWQIRIRLNELVSRMSLWTCVLILWVFEMPLTRVVCATFHFRKLQSTVLYTRVPPSLNHRNNNTKMTNYIKIIRYLFFFFFVPSRIDTMVWQYFRWLESRSFRNGENYTALFRNGHDSISQEIHVHVIILPR